MLADDNKCIICQPLSVFWLKSARKIAGLFTIPYANPGDLLLSTQKNLFLSGLLDLVYNFHFVPLGGGGG